MRYAKRSSRRKVGYERAKDPRIASGAGFTDIMKPG
jgi:hypothetical protein